MKIIVASNNIKLIPETVDDLENLNFAYDFLRDSALTLYRTVTYVHDTKQRKSEFVFSKIGEKVQESR